MEDDKIQPNQIIETPKLIALRLEFANRIVVAGITDGTFGIPQADADEVAGLMTGIGMSEWALTQMHAAARKPNDAVAQLDACVDRLIARFEDLKARATRIEAEIYRREFGINKKPA